MNRVRVSDYAVLRWLEQVEGVDVGAIRRRIARSVRRGVEEQADGIRIDGVTFRLHYDGGDAMVVNASSPHIREHLAQPRRAAADIDPAD